MEAGTSVPPEEAGLGYSSAAVAGAAVLTVLMPLIALITALLLMRGQSVPRRRSQLRGWAWISAGWAVLVVVVLLLLQTITLT